VQFEVLDSGIGMTEEQIARLFQSFSQADSSMTRRFGGTGLGLALSRRLTEMLGGTITVRSTVGRGSAFLITIRARRLERNGAFRDDVPGRGGPPVEEAPRSAGEATLAGCRLLLAEDAPDNQRLLCQLLRKAGALVEIAGNGRLAVDLALAARERAGPFDVVLMDMQMPVLDGYEATMLLRASGYTLPIVALTAHVMAADKERCLEAGCDDYATKPIDQETLIAVVRKHAESRMGVRQSWVVPIFRP